jgi:hypothetical protein
MRIIILFLITLNLFGCQKSPKKLSGSEQLNEKQDVSSFDKNLSLLATFHSNNFNSKDNIDAINAMRDKTELFYQKKYVIVKEKYFYLYKNPGLVISYFRDHPKKDKNLLQYYDDKICNNTMPQVISDIFKNEKNSEIYVISSFSPSMWQSIQKNPDLESVKNPDQLLYAFYEMEENPDYNPKKYDSNKC